MEQADTILTIIPKVDTSFGNSNASSNSSAKGKSDLLWKPGFGHGNSNTAKDDADRELNRIRRKYLPPSRHWIA